MSRRICFLRQFEDLCYDRLTLVPVVVVALYMSDEWRVVVNLG